MTSSFGSKHDTTVIAGVVVGEIGGENSMKDIDAYTMGLMRGLLHCLVVIEEEEGAQSPAFDRMVHCVILQGLQYCYQIIHPQTGTAACEIFEAVTTALSDICDIERNDIPEHLDALQPQTATQTSVITQ
jgi:hypothetical protein